MKKDKNHRRVEIEKSAHNQPGCRECVFVFVLFSSFWSETETNPSNEKWQKCHKIPQVWATLIIFHPVAFCCVFATHCHSLVIYLVNSINSLHPHRTMTGANVPYICACIRCPNGNSLVPFWCFSFVNFLAYSSVWQVNKHIFIHTNGAVDMLEIHLTCKFWWMVFVQAHQLQPPQWPVQRRSLRTQQVQTIRMWWQLDRLWCAHPY